MAKVAAELGKPLESPLQAGIYVWSFEDHEKSLDD